MVSITAKIFYNIIVAMETIKNKSASERDESVNRKFIELFLSSWMKMNNVHFIENFKKELKFIH